VTRALAAALGVSVLVTLAGGCASRRPAAPAPAARGRLQTIAVFPFDNHAVTDRDRLDFLREWLPDMLANRLAQSGEMRVVERRELLRILEEQKLGASELASNEGRLRLGRIVGAQTLLFGGFSAVAEQMQIDARVVDAESGVVLRSLNVAGETGAARQLADQLSDRLADGLGIQLTRQAIAANLADDRALAAAEHYYRGLALERQGATDAAIDAYRQALELDHNDAGSREHLEKLLKRAP
jgi:curli biogenesis system outer membrane secretion channel CsgG